MSSLKPKEIVSELDRYIVAQDGAKRAVAIALRNRWSPIMREDGIRLSILWKWVVMVSLDRFFGLHSNCWLGPILR